jgi:hypothetical protein
MDSNSAPKAKMCVKRFPLSPNYFSVSETSSLSRNLPKAARIFVGEIKIKKEVHKPCFRAAAGNFLRRTLRGLGIYRVLLRSTQDPTSC